VHSRYTHSDTALPGGGSSLGLTSLFLTTVQEQDEYRRREYSLEWTDGRTWY